MSSPWPKVRLGDVLRHYQKYIDAPDSKVYPKLSVRLYGKGVVLDIPVEGSTLKMKRHQLAKAGQVILSEIWGKKGAIGLVPLEGEGALCTSHFFLFDIITDKLNPKWLQAIFDSNFLEGQLNAEAKGTTGYAAVRPKNLLACEIPLPPLAEQRRIAARIEELAAKVAEARRIRQIEEIEIRQLLLGAFRHVSFRARTMPMKKVAPLVRRAIVVEETESYSELGIRSFGKGTFHKPVIKGFDLGKKHIFHINPGDLLFSNIFAWEGAIAVAKPEDSGRVGSHRYITCLPEQGVMTSQFLAFYFLTDEGMEKIRKASPGSAGRNRTLSLTALENMEVPVPDIAKQKWFNTLQEKVNALKRLQAETAAELDALLPAILDRAFKGQLVPAETVTSNVAEFPVKDTKSENHPKRHFARALLSAEIVHCLHAEPTFGRIKHQKLLHLCEHIAQIIEIEGEYHREAAGPLDNKLIYANVKELKKQKWYEEVTRKPYGHAYLPLTKAGTHRSYIEKYWPDKLAIVSKLINLMRTWDTERCEIFSTVYAAWNDLLLWGREATDEAILNEILEHWHDSKKRIPKERWLKAIEWMRQEHYVPTGFGKPTREDSHA